MENNNIQILGLNETKKKGKGCSQLTTKHTLYYSGVKPEQRAKEGVGIIVTEEIKQKVIQFKEVDSRIIVISIKLEEIINFIQIYGPVEGTAEEEILEFYIQLQRVLDEVREENEQTIIMGDWNSRVGNDYNRGMGCMGKHGEETINRNGLKMIDFCRRNDLIIGNTMWEQQLNDKYTFVAEGRNAKILIDYITYTQNLTEVMQKIETKKEAEIGSNHRLVVTICLVKLLTKEATTDYSKLATYKLKNKDIEKKYQNETNKEFDKLEKEKADWALEGRWIAFKETLLTATEKICGKIKYNNNIKRTNWWNNEIKIAVKEKKTAWKKYITCGQRRI